MSAAVLEIRNLSVAYHSARGAVQAVNDVDLTLNKGDVFGLVGESGSGKSTLAYAIMRLLRDGARVTKGTVRINGQDLYGLSEEAVRQFRWTQVSMVFQSAMNALNPVMSIEDQILDTLSSHRKNMSRAEGRKRAQELMDLVRIDRKRLHSYPHELSGGMKQRVVMAIALAFNPSLVIMDEPTTALDVVVQKSILDEIRQIQRDAGFSILFISHDFSLVTDIASHVAIMYAGRFVEVTNREKLAKSTDHHPYTQGLLRAIPRLTWEDVSIEGIPGSPPDLIDLPSGCAFHPRCSQKFDRCGVDRPQPAIVAGNHVIECHLFDPAGRREYAKSSLN